MSEPGSADNADLAISHFLVWFSHGARYASLVGIDAEVFGRSCLLANAVIRAISERGARVGELVEVIERVRADGARDDEPTRRFMRGSPTRPGWWNLAKEWPY